ncbi:MAG: four helix bundle protein [Muribaculaceae bacterium]|nr:four helix bundle protein [Muribaculaceae bacterium]
MKTSDYKDLRVWQQSMDLVTEIYKLMYLLPMEERFGLSDQIRRAAVSIPSNIAEGQARGSNKEFRHFLSISRGSLAELETQLLLTVRLGFLQEQQVADILTRLKDIDKMIGSLMRYLKD